MKVSDLLVPSVSFYLLLPNGPACHFMHASGHEILHQVVQNDGDHDSWIRAKHKRGQDQPGPVVIHPQSIHERDAISIIDLEQSTQPITGGKGRDTEARSDGQRHRQKVEIAVRDGLRKGHRSVRIVQQQQDNCIDQFDERHDGR